MIFLGILIGYFTAKTITNWKHVEIRSREAEMIMDRDSLKVVDDMLRGQGLDPDEMNEVQIQQVIAGLKLILDHRTNKFTNKGE